MKTYTLTLQQIETLADALSAADGHIADGTEDKAMIHEAHGVLIAALGVDEALIYGADFAAPHPIADAVRKSVQAESDRWALFLDARHQSSAMRNENISHAYREGRDSMRMYLLTRYGRAFQVEA